MPRLSVALCTYNGASYLQEQLDSIAAQSRLPDELVLRDDGSTDDTVALARAFAARAPFPVRVLADGTNVGYVKNFEAAIAACTGDLVALSDQDDVWLPHKLARLEEALGDDPRALLVFSDATLVDEALRPLGRTMWESLHLRPDVRARIRAGGARTPLMRLTVITGATACFRAALVPLALPIDLPHWHDAWLGLVATLHGRVVLVDEPLVLYRQHGRNALGAPAAADRHLGRRAVAFVRRRQARRAGRYDAIDFEAAEIAGRLSDMARQARARGAGALPADVDRALGRAESFHAFRAGLPGYPRRLPAVLRRLGAGRYHAFGEGLKMAATDLLR